MLFPHGRVVTLIRGGTVDQYGNPTEGTDRIDIPGCAVAPRTSTDTTDRGRSGVVVGLSVYLPAGADVQPGDGFEIDGVAWQIEGVPGEWTSPFTGWAAGIEVALSRGEG